MQKRNYLYQEAIGGLILSMVVLFLILPLTKAWAKHALPTGFVYLSETAPSIQQDIRYTTRQNFLGRPVKGYQVPTCILSTPAAEALAKVQAQAMQAGYTLKVYDCYRPQRAVNYFVDWAKRLNDQDLKPWFYPDVPKSLLFQQGYIAARSSHSRGSTVDLTLVPLHSSTKAKQPIKLAEATDCRHPDRFLFPDDSIDMGTAFDCFDPMSHTDAPNISQQAQANRQALKQLMKSHGFQNLPEEWWHFTLKNEPFPTRYFNFPVRKP